MKSAIPHTILMTADPVGGVWTYALELTKALRKFEIKVHLASMGGEISKSQWRTAEKLNNLTVHESKFALEWMDDPWKEVDEAGEWLLDLERQIRPDLIHLNNYAHGSLPWSAPVLTTGHSCVLSWWQAVKKEDAPRRWNTYATRVKEGLQHSNCVVGVTRYMLDRLKQHYGPFSNSGFIYNARDKSRFHPSNKKPFIFSMGRLWDEAKNISALQNIAGQLSWPVYIAGEDRDKISPETDNLHLLGKINSTEVTEWLSEAGIYVLPARYEPFGLSALEAALSGCALILGDIPSLREVWADAALYADPGDPEALKYQIMKLSGNAAKRRRMSQKAMQRAERYTPDRFSRQYVSFYQQLIPLKNKKSIATNSD